MDLLALPAVPPPAPSTHPWRDRILAVVFVALVSFPSVALLWTAEATTLRFEHRAATPWPASPFEPFAPRFERAFSDRFGWRDELLALHHAVLMDLFRVSPSPNVLLGKDHWLFFLGEEGTSLDVFYRGQPRLDDRRIDALADELERRARFLARQHIEYVVTVVPDKYSIYPEKLPDWVGAPDEPTPLDRLSLAVQQRGVRFVNLKGPLRNAKPREQLYFRSDSHWNVAGATIGYEALMQEVQKALPGRVSAIATVPRPPWVPGDVYRGDLARMTGLRPQYDEPDRVSLARILAAAASRCAQRVDDRTIPEIEAYECGRPGLPRAVVYRDSMAIALIPLLSENFSRVIYVTSHRLDPALVSREKPDIVIDEVVERAMLEPADEAMPEVE